MECSRQGGSILSAAPEQLGDDCSLGMQLMLDPKLLQTTGTTLIRPSLLALLLPSLVAAGFEPAISCVSSRCSSRLNYATFIPSLRVSPLCCGSGFSASLVH